MNSWIKATPKEQPVFAWLAFTAPHDPLQAPDEWIKRFKGQYEQGYAEVYRQRIARLKALGIIHDDTPLPHLELDKEWEALTPEQQKYTAKVMQVYAAMIANMDAQIGTLMETLKQTGRDKNTLLVFLTDNGANPAQGFITNLPPNSGSSSITAMTTWAAKDHLSPTAPTGPTSATPPTPIITKPPAPRAASIPTL